MKKKLKLNDLKVQSFVTSVDSQEIKGGAESGVLCPTNECTGIYPTVPLAACALTGTNGYNCPSDILDCRAQSLTC